MALDSLSIGDSSARLQEATLTQLFPLFRLLRLSRRAQPACASLAGLGLETFDTTYSSKPLPLHLLACDRDPPYPLKTAQHSSPKSENTRFEH